MNINEETLAFYHQLGVAITTWAHVEFAIAGIVAGRFSDQADRQRALAGFYSIENFRTKLQHAAAIMSMQKLSTADAAEWAIMLDRSGTLARHRNKLAHYWMLTDGTTDKAGRRVMLLPTRPTKRQQRQKYPGAIYLRDVVRYRLEFFALTAALENFGARLSGRQEPFPKSQGQPVRPPTIAQLRRTIYAYASHPPSSK